MPVSTPKNSFSSLDPIEPGPPAADEFEISLFGPGIGECLVIHLGNGHWMVVDSCSTDKKSREPVASHYLHSIGLNPSECIQEIVISHWHDDHTGGAATLVEQCPKAFIYYSAAIKTDEFMTLTELLATRGRIVDRNNNGIHEMAEVLHILAARAEKDKHYVAHHFRALITNRELQSLTAGGQTVTVRALSPSDVAFNLSKLELRKLIPADGTPPRALPRPKRNPAAVALWIEFGDRAVLLGSDLEEPGEPHTGWSVVVSEHRARGKATVFKIPHHGSVTGHCEAVWSEMLTQQPIAFTTTFSRSGLPTGADIERIKRYTDTFACTTVPRSTLPKRDPAVERAMREVASGRRPLRGEMGHIQVRLRADGSVQMRGNARSVLL